MNLIQRIDTFNQLGEEISQVSNEELQQILEKIKNQNPWFTENNTRLALTGITKYLTKINLTKWTSSYDLNPRVVKNIGVSMAGNIPLAGFHDFLCILIAGHNLVAKLSSQDSILMNWLSDRLISIEPEFSNRISFQERLNKVDAMIATGSDNTARYFEYYFRKVPHIIRKNRSSCAILMGEESNDELTILGQDVFSYFGLGCRNVSKLFVPEGYTFIGMLDSWVSYQNIIHHHKYCNNYDYQKSILLVNGTPFLDTGYVLVTENEALVSPISTVYYETYADQNDLSEKLNKHQEKLQCFVSANAWYNNSVPFGEAQLPEVWDYADNIDTLKFLEFRN
ncbi:MAG: acyl-CoA reductase [Bacteroidia bacterium]|nr:acyl-CoA reductase [Bacteroidia bacterium]